MLLLIYNNRFCREFMLSNLHNADYHLNIPGKAYGLEKDFVLCLDAAEEGWKLEKAADYRIWQGNKEWEVIVLKEHEHIEIQTVNGKALQVIIVNISASIHIMEKYDLSFMSQVSIGKSEGNIICYNFRNMISDYHAELIRHSDGWYLVDKSVNGVFHEKGKIDSKYKMKFGEHFNIFGLHLIFLGDTLAVGTYYGDLIIKEDILKHWEEPREQIDERRQTILQTEYFNRAPRDIPSLYEEEVEIEGAPAPREMKNRPWFLTVGPSFTMAIPMLLGCGLSLWGASISGAVSGVFMYTGVVTAIGSAVLGAFWAMTNLKYAQKEQREDEEYRFNAYSAYLIKITEELQKKYQYNAQTMRKMYPSAAECSKYTIRDFRLWNRNHTHGDFLKHRLGIGEMPFQVQIKIPKEKFTLTKDSLLGKPRMIQEQFQTLYEVPVGISFQQKQLIGIVGGKNRRGAVEVMHSIVAEIAASHCYTDVKFVFLYQESDMDRRKEWECMRWFPHVWSEDRHTRYMASNEIEKRDVLFELSNILRSRMMGTDTRSKQGIAKPYYLLFVSDISLLKDEALTKYIYEPKPAYGITTFLMTEQVEELPNACVDIIENDNYFQGYYNLLEGRNEWHPVKLDRISVPELEQMARNFADIRVDELESTSEIPEMLDFFSMYDVKMLEEFQVENRWRKNRTYNSMKVLIGKKAGGADCFLDVHEKYHGPHGLIAGTTGSGKSETLQTYILSLALNFSPEDIAFFIIDFKGGGMADLFSSLPHMAGQISNLSGAQIHRAMVSIKSENQRRQRIFSENGVNNINLYTKLYKNQEVKIPIPHLFIIIDEFAELKKEEPDFMRELISVAQVGRSLGVHLILATQKPAGTVDDNIWSNSRFRICLRVQDRQDSNDMLHKSDAAFLTQAGRGYLQIGNDEIYELFQSGWSGASYDGNLENQKKAAVLLTRTGKMELIGNRIKQSRKEGEIEKRETQLEAVIRYLNLAAEKMGYKTADKLWLPVLKSRIYLNDMRREKLRKDTWHLKACVGLCDDPEKQRQFPLELDFSVCQNLAVVGAAVSGKSVFLQTLLYDLFTRYTPEQLQCYIVDFSNHMLAPFEGSPHVGGIIYDSEVEKFGKLIHMMERIMEERKRQFKGGNFIQYVQVYRKHIPAFIIVIDNLEALRDKTKMRYDEQILHLAREGNSYGIYLAITASGYGSDGISGRMAENIRTAISLEQSDKYKYLEAMRVTRLSVMPEAGIKGRGLVNVGGRILEFQTALCVEAEDDFSRIQLIEKTCLDMKAKWHGILPEPIPEIPENPTFGKLSKVKRYQEMVERGDEIPAAYEKDTAEVFGVSLRDIYCYVISGRAHTGKTNAMKVFIYSVGLMEAETCVIETGQTELKKAAEESGAKYLTELSEIFTYFKELTPIFAERNQKKRKLVDEGKDEEEIYWALKEERPIFIFLGNLVDFFGMVYQADATVGNMSGFMENIFEKGRLHGIYFFGCLKPEDNAKLNAYKAFRLFAGYRKGIHLGGNFSDQKIFNFQNIPYSELVKTMKKGEAYATDRDNEAEGVHIVLPLARKE